MTDLLDPGGWARELRAHGAGGRRALVVGLARPPREERVPRESATVMLVLDTSASMAATDVSPSRLDAATGAARSSVDDLPEPLRVGLVSFDGTTRVVARPTTDHGLVARALDTLGTGPGTATGEGLAAALAAIETVSTGERNAATVLLSDGETTVGRPVEAVAVDAAEAGVPVTTTPSAPTTARSRIEDRQVPVPAARRRCARWPRRPAPASSRRAPPAGCAASTTTSAAASARRSSVGRSG